MSSQVNWKHDDLAHDLAEHLARSSDRMIWTDMQLGPSGSPRPDVYTINKRYSTFCPVAYECKISVSDFRSDVTRGKWQSYLKFASGVIFAAPKGLISKDDVPKTCGLIVRSETGWRTIKGPTMTPVKELPRDAWLGEGQDYSGTGNDVPLAEVTYDDVSLEVKAGVVGYQYSVMELATAAQVGIQLDADKVQAARLAYEKHMSKIAFVGNAAIGLKGLYNQTGVSVHAAAKDWETATPDEILADFNGILAEAIDASEFDSSLAPNTVLLALSLMRILSERRLADNLETTLFEWISKNNVLALEGKPLVIRGKSNLETAGVGGTRRTVVYRRDPACIEMRIPQDLQFLAAQPTGLDVYFPGHYLYQGVWLKRVDSLRYLDVPQKA